MKPKPKPKRSWLADLTGPVSEADLTNEATAELVANWEAKESKRPAKTFAVEGVLTISQRRVSRSATTRENQDQQALERYVGFAQQAHRRGYESKHWDHLCYLFSVRVLTARAMDDEQREALAEMSTEDLSALLQQIIDDAGLLGYKEGWEKQET